MPTTPIDLPTWTSAPFLLMREAAHSTREQYQLGLLGSACAREFHTCRGPGERSGFVLREGRENGKRVRAAAAGEAGEIFMALADRHGNHVRCDAWGEDRSSAHTSLRRCDFYQIAMTNAQTLSGLG